jgi:hypothetical protein
VSLEPLFVFVAVIAVEDEAEMSEIPLSPIRDGIIGTEIQNE